MRRRTVLAGASAILPLLAGCTGSSDGGATTTTDETDTDDPEPTTDGGTAGGQDLVSGSLVPREECPTPGEATVELGDGSATVRGCVVGKNGCTVPRLLDLTLDADTGVATVVVAAVEEREEGEACTEALVNLGYEVRVDSGGATLSGVEVVHDDVNGRRVVADVTR
ncbi:MAG: hypothetical protein ABEJ97_06860 [Halobellus sp.]